MAKYKGTKGNSGGKVRISRKQNFEKAVGFTNKKYPNVYAAAEALASTIASVSPSDAKPVGIFVRGVLSVSVHKRLDGAVQERKTAKLERAKDRRAKAQAALQKYDKTIAELGAGVVGA